MNLKDNLLNSKTWIRIILILLAFLPRVLVMWLVNAIAFVQCLFVLVTGRKSDNIDSFSIMLGTYLVQIVDYQTFVSDKKPFPFSTFPDDSREPDTDEVVFVD